MSTESSTGRSPIINPKMRVSRLRVPRTRGAIGGALVLILGAWAALVPFIGPSFDLAYTPAPGQTWHWTAARAWFEVLPGGVAFVGGLLLLVSGNRLITSLGGWLAALAGAWLIVGSSLAGVLSLNLGRPDPARSTGTQAAAQLLLFYGVGAAILVSAAMALGRLSVLTVRDVLAAERHADADAATPTSSRPDYPAPPPPPAEEPSAEKPPAEAAPAEAGASHRHAVAGRWRHLIHHGG